MNKKYDLSVIIPARNEEFLSVTIDNILKNKRAKTEIIAVLDGVWSNPPIKQHPDVNIIHTGESIGQRAATNLGVKISKSRYIMKLDAHCSWDEGCDKKMIEAFKKVGDDVTLVPIMRNLWMFDWKCYKCGWKQYQGPTPKKCPDCGRTDSIHKKMLVIGKERPQSTSYCFDSEPHFQYFKQHNKRPEVRKQAAETGFTETMSLQGSCFMSTREKYWELKLCDEEFGSWGNQGIEVAVKTWLSGGKVLVCHSTFYAHMFRTQGGDFSFPYHQSGSAVARCKAAVRKQVWLGQLPKQIRPLSWLVRRFMPVPGWTEEKIRDLEKHEKHYEKKKSI